MTDEWYLVYCIKDLSSDDGWYYDIPMELVERYERVMEEFDEVQEELRDIYKSQDPILGSGE
jgi:hypothetical protein